MQREIFYQIVTDEVQRLCRHVTYILKSGSLLSQSSWETFADTATPGTENKGQSHLCPQIPSQVKDTPAHVKQNCLESCATKPKELPHSAKRRCLRMWGIFTGVLKGTLNAYTYPQGKCLPWCFLPWVFVKLAEGTRNTSGLSCPLPADIVSHV